MEGTLEVVLGHKSVTWILLLQILPFTEEKKKNNIQICFCCNFNNGRRKLKFALKKRCQEWKR